MRRLLLSLTVALWAAPAVATADENDLLEKMVWTAQPEARDVLMASPPVSRSSIRSGIVTLDCTVREDLGRDCAVARERPLNRNFGRAALELSALYRSAPTTIDGQPVVGERVLLPMRFDRGGRRGLTRYISLGQRNPPPGNPVYSPLF